jgi:hypothetical protein
LAFPDFTLTVVFRFEFLAFRAVFLMAFFAVFAAVFARLAGFFLLLFRALPLRAFRFFAMSLSLRVLV